MINTKIFFNPLNWFIVFLMVLIPCMAMELILNRKENGCPCGHFLNPSN